MKIEEQVLSREQMKHLQELGFDTSDASMCWMRYDVGGVVKQFVEINDKKCIELYSGTPYPTYTIGDLIAKLPKDVRNYDLEIHCDFKCLGYAARSDFEYFIEYDRLIDGLYDLLCWVAENHKELLEVKK